MGRLMKFLRCPKGGSSIEYALVASLIAIAAIFGMRTLGNNLVVTYNNVSNNL